MSPMERMRTALLAAGAVLNAEYAPIASIRWLERPDQTVAFLLVKAQDIAPFQKHPIITRIGIIADIAAEKIEMHYSLKAWVEQRGRTTEHPSIWRRAINNRMIFWAAKPDAARPVRYQFPPRPDLAAGSPPLYLNLFDDEPPPTDP